MTAVYDDGNIHGLPPAQAPEPQTPVKTLVVIAALFLAAMAFVVFGVGYALGWWAGDDAPQEIAEASAPAPKPEPEPEPELFGAEPIPSGDPGAIPEPVDISNDPLFGAEPVPEAPAGGSSGGSGNTGSGQRANGGSGGGGRASITSGSGPRVTLDLVLVHYDHVELKLGGTVFRLNGSKTIKVRPGAYRAELRKGSDAAWVSAGLITVELGSRYKVKLYDPPLAQVQRLD